MNNASGNNCECCGHTLAMITLRIWLAIRAIVAGVEKFAGSEASSRVVDIDGAPNAYGLTESTSDKIYSLSNYHGVPEALMRQFEGQPLIPRFMLGVFDTVLGPVLILMGATLLLGVATRLSLLAMGLVYTALTFGLILIKQEAGVAWLGVHVFMIAYALTLTQHNRFVLLRKW